MCKKGKICCTRAKFKMLASTSLTGRLSFVHTNMFIALEQCDIFDLAFSSFFLLCYLLCGFAFSTKLYAMIAYILPRHCLWIDNADMWLLLCFVQFYKQSEIFKSTLHYMNAAFTALFTLECSLKLAAYGVRVRHSWKKVYSTLSTLSVRFSCSLCTYWF